MDYKEAAKELWNMGETKIGKHTVEWKIVYPETDDGAQACDWDEAEDVEFETYVYYEHGHFGF